MQKKSSHRSRSNRYPDQTEEEESLLLELIGYSRQGVDLLLEGHRRSPIQIAHAIVHDCDKGESYMRDYQTDNSGNVEQIDFTKVRRI